MRRYNLSELRVKDATHFLEGIVKGKKLVKGGLHFYKPGEQSHPEGNHVHQDEEVFVNLQGRARLVVDGKDYEFKMGDIVVIEPGEEHYIFADEKDPVVNLWLHAQ